MQKVNYCGIFFRFSHCVICLSVIVMLCAVWYHLHDLKNVKNIHGGVLFLVKLQANACNFTNSSTPPWVFFSRFLNRKNNTKLSQALYMLIIGQFILEKVTIMSTSVFLFPA